jgi:hypothetical protein
MSIEYTVYGCDDFGYYSRKYDNEADVLKVVKSGTVEQVVKTVITEHRWGGDYRTGYKVPANWSDNSETNDF